MKKLLAIVLFALMLCTLIPFATVSTFAADEPTVELVLNKTEVNAGGEFEVTVNLLNLAETDGLISALVEIGFDTDVFEVVTYFDEDEEMWLPQIEVGSKYNASNNKYISYGQIYDDGTMKNCLVKYMRATASATQVRREEYFCTITLKVKDDAASGTYDLNVLQMDGIYLGNAKFQFATMNTTITVNGSEPAHTCSATTLTPVEGKSATCTEAGWNGYYKCSDETCGKLYASADATGEILDLEAWKTGDGKIEAKGHGETNGFRYNSNNNGTHDVVCDDCGQTTETNVDCSGTSTECEGTDTCSKCGGTFDLAHNITYVPEVIPENCQQTGHGEYWYCDKCEAYFGDAEGSYQINPAWINYTGEHVRPEDAADCATVACELCGEDIYGLGEHNTGVPACQTGTCSKCNETITGYGCVNYTTPACMDGTCYYCGGIVAGMGHENGAWAPCKKGECSYGCGLEYPATAEHIDDDGNGYCDTCWDHLNHDVDPCVGGMCSICEAYVEPAHEYMYPCDQYCCICYEKTNPDATHSIIHVEAKPAESCIVYGNREYWYCEYCSATWLDSNCTMMTNMMSVKVAGDCVSDAEYPCLDGNCVNCGLPVAATENHKYFYACDQYCMNCGEKTNPNATHSITHVEAKPGTNCQTYDGHMEYWTCSHCGGVWTDENLMHQTNMMSIKVNGEHTYTYDCDTNCKVCEELTRPEAKHEGGTATCVAKAVCQYCETPYGELAKCTNLTPINGQDATCNASGWKEYWKCFTCNTLYADSDATKKIDDFAAWKSEGGEGYIAVDLNNHVGPETSGGFTSNGDGTHYETITCTSCLNAKRTVSGTCSGGAATCTAPAVCTECSTAYGELNADNHDWQFNGYTNDDDATHTINYVCGHNASHTKSESGKSHDYDSGTSAYTCICGDVKQFKVYWYDSNGNELGTSSVDYGAPLPTCPYTPTIPEGYYVVGWCYMYSGDPAPETMPANSLYLKYLINPIKYTVTFLYENGETWEVHDSHHGDVIKNLAKDHPYPDTKVGHTFIGWGVKNETTGKIELVTTMTATGNLTLYPVFEVNKYTLTIYALQVSGDADPENCPIEITVPYGALLKDYIPENCGAVWNYAPIHEKGETVPVNGTRYNGVYAIDEWYDMDWNVVDMETATMPAGNFGIKNDYYYTGWWNVFWDAVNQKWSDTALGTAYQIDSSEAKGWQQIDGDWYYFAYDAKQSHYFRVEGLTRVPYPTVSINGVTYAPNQEDIDYATNKDTTFKDATEAWFGFDEDGKFQSDFTGLTAHPAIEGAMCYAENGMIVWHPGFVKVENVWYYFVGDTDNGGNKMAEGVVYVTRNCEAAGYTKGEQIVFTNGKVNTTFDGIVEGYYYEGGKLMAGEGLVKIEEGKYIYVRSSGKVATGMYWVTKTNGLVTAAMYNFGTDGILQSVKDPSVNGLVEGVYYKNGNPYYAGLIAIGEDIYYVKSNGEVATGWYYITKTNDMEGFVKGEKYCFGEDGKMEAVKNGIFDGYYYENNHVKYGAGLIKYQGNIYYVRSNGQVATGKYYVTNTNGMEGFVTGQKCYFDENGKLIQDGDSAPLAEGSKYFGSSDWEIVPENAVLIFTPEKSGKLIVEVTGISSEIAIPANGFSVDAYDGEGYVGETACEGTGIIEVELEAGKQWEIYVRPAIVGDGYFMFESGTIEYRITFIAD